MVVNNKVKNKIVIDSSALLSELLPDEKPSRLISQTILDYQNDQVDLFAPELLRYEIGNVLKSLILSGRTNVESATAIFETFLNLEITYLKIDYSEVLSLAISTKTSFYDASYLFLAKKLDTDLLTLDKKLAQILNLAENE